MIRHVDLPAIEVEIIDPEVCDGFEPYIDTISAIFNPRRGWWEVDGDNTGECSLIVHPYQIAGFLELFNAMQEANRG